MKKIVRINGQLFYMLRTAEGGARTLALYLHLRRDRGIKHIYKAYRAKNNKWVGGYNLLHKETGISLSALKKYVPILINMNLVSFSNDGSLIIKGTKQINKEYVNKKGKAKIIPILMSDKFTNTAFKTFNVSLSSDFSKQQFTVQQKKLVASLKANKLHNFDEIQLARKTEKKLQEKFGDNAEVIRKGNTLSNLSFFFLKCPCVKYDYKKNRNRISQGNYLKKKLVDSGVITSKRDNEKLFEASYKEYLNYRSNMKYDKTLRYFNGYIRKELTSIITVCNIQGMQ